ncbi:glycosyltransferase family 8 protein [Saccharococcus thermophilus]|jgi:lipopolysaccharide biosynthesis glycosyltransferase|uniref:Lipopolysaccharide biosynthesis glycosyltransferase n=1 Tax=Saccharococcus thermophilus TaxID=29396 RepID=A0A846MLD6_9BACL|nr:glycosyltransferase family 8 protein [Saccharococcus thermophilus]NIK16434.1 lipopolysaccharide biosynthesis glycosyltransferase [Saccharococcus thermophilus]
MFHVLVTLDANYLPPLKVLMNSLFRNNNRPFTFYLLYSRIPDIEIELLKQFVERQGHQLVPIYVDSELFADAPVFRHYTAEMYYRLAAHQFLPLHLDRVLYLDPDIVAINPIDELYDMDFEGNMFIAAEHTHSTKVTNLFNKLRLKTPNAKGYFNTGVMMMNLEMMRKEVRMEDIYQFIRENRFKLVLPDQDVLNGLYWDKIKPVDGYRYNYDARYYDMIQLLPNPKHDLYWILENTIFIHYCGKDKPWKENYKGELGLFYKRYSDVLQLEGETT